MPTNRGKVWRGTKSTTVCSASNDPVVAAISPPASAVHVNQGHHESLSPALLAQIQTLFDRSDPREPPMRNRRLNYQ